MNAAGPSLASSVRTTRSRYASARISASCSGRSMPLRIARRVPRTASGALRLTMRGDLVGPVEQPVVLDHLGDRGRARRPACALSRSCLPISARRMATLIGSTRARRTISRPETRPMLTWGSKNSARSDAMAMSDGGHQVEAGAAAEAVHRGEHRLGHGPERRRGLLGRLPLRVGGQVRLVVDDPAVVGDLADVGAGAERPARPGDDDRPHGVVALGRGRRPRGAPAPSAG